jgi:NDP-sugar pyrophosphorylase family protein
MKIDIVIMCGGTGKRLRPLTYIMPKPFLKTNNISSFDYILKNIRVSNISKIFVSLFYKENIAKKIINKKKIPR